MIMWILLSVWAAVAVYMLAGCVLVAIRQHTLRSRKDIVMAAIALPIISAEWPLLFAMAFVLNLPRIVAKVRS